MVCRRDQDYGQQANVRTDDGQYGRGRKCGAGWSDRCGSSRYTNLAGDSGDSQRQVDKSGNPGENYLKNSYDNPEEAYEGLKKRQLSGDLGRPEDVAQAALFLASDESKFMMGSPLYIDGGVVFGKNA